MALSPPQQQRIHLIFNSVSGTRNPHSDLKLLTALLHPANIWHTTPDHSAYHLSTLALSDTPTPTHLIACGGDGTVTSVARAVKDAPHPVTLAVIPRGTANALCAALHIPTDLRHAARMIRAGATRRIDVAVVEAADRPPVPMLLLCGVGLEAETIKRAHRGLKTSFGAAAYAIAGLASTWNSKNFTADIVLSHVQDSLMFASGLFTADTVRLQGLRLRGLTVANAAPPTSVLAQGIGTVRPDDGYLEVVCVTSRTPLRMLYIMCSQLISGLLRRRQRRGNVYGLRAKNVHITCHPPQRIVVDGEEAGLTPVTIAMDGVVHVIAPPASVVNRRGRSLSRALVRFWRNLRGVAVFLVAITFAKRRCAAANQLTDQQLLCIRPEPT